MFVGLLVYMMKEKTTATVVTSEHSHVDLTTPPPIFKTHPRNPNHAAKCRWVGIDELITSAQNAKNGVCGFWRSFSASLNKLKGQYVCLRFLEAGF